jgi:hypothetical protein
VNPDDKEPTGGEPVPASPEPGGVWLPPRLRQKLESPSSGDDFDFLKKKSSPVGTIITVAVIVAVLAGAFMVYQNNQHKLKAAAAAKAAAERAAFVADSLAQVHMADSLRAVAVAESVAFAALPKWKQKKVLAEKAKKAAAASGATAAGATPPKGGATPAAGGAAGGTTAAAAAGGAAGGAAAGAPEAAAAPEEAGPFGIDAGQFLDETKAGEVATDLKGKTGLAATVVPMGEGDDTSYHVVLGSYPHRGAAESKANSLLAKGMLSEASVVALTKH